MGFNLASVSKVRMKSKLTETENLNLQASQVVKAGFRVHRPVAEAKRRPEQRCSLLMWLPHGACRALSCTPNLSSTARPAEKAAMNRDDEPRLSETGSI